MRTAEERQARNERIMELYTMGHDRQFIAAVVDLTPQRVSQIVNMFGYGWAEWARDGGKGKAC